MLFVMGVFVVPRFTVFYDAMDLELPLITRMIVGLSLFLRHNLLPAGGRRADRRRHLGALETDRRRPARGRPVPASAAVPGAGARTASRSPSSAARCRRCSRAACRLVPALEISTRSVGNVWVAVEGRADRPAGARGTGLPRRARLDRRSSRTSRSTWSRSARRPARSIRCCRASRTSSTRRSRPGCSASSPLIEPLMLVIMGTLVALLLVAVYLPMFSALGRIQ